MPFLDSCRKTLVSALFGANMLFGCGDECKNPEMTYDLSGQDYARAGRSSSLNVGKGILVGEDIAGFVSLLDYRPNSYNIPNSYVVFCSNNGTDYPLEYFISLDYADGGYVPVGPINPLPSRYGAYSMPLRPDDFDGVVGLACGMLIPEKWACEGGGCWLETEQELVGVVRAGLMELGLACFDWYYEDRYHKDAGLVDDDK